MNSAIAVPAFGWVAFFTYPYSNNLYLLDSFVWITVLVLFCLHQVRKNKSLMQTTNFWLGKCSDKRPDCKELARDNHCHSNPYTTLRECPKACGVCSKWNALIYCFEGRVTVRGEKRIKVKRGRKNAQKKSGERRNGSKFLGGRKNSLNLNREMGYSIRGSSLLQF